MYDRCSDCDHLRNVVILASLPQTHLCFPVTYGYKEIRMLTGYSNLPNFYYIYNKSENIA